MSDITVRFGGAQIVVAAGESTGLADAYAAAAAESLEQAQQIVAELPATIQPYLDNVNEAVGTIPAIMQPYVDEAQQVVDTINPKLGELSERSGYHSAWTTSAGLLNIGFRSSDSRPIFGNGGDVVGRIEAQEAAVEIVTSARSGIALAGRLANGQLPWLVDSWGRFWANGHNVAAELNWLLANGGGGGSPALSTDLVVIGDSIAAPGSGVGPDIAGLFPGRTTYGNGIGGEDPVQIFQRQGGVPTTGVVAGGSIPASGAVAVTGLNLLNGSADRSIAAEVIPTSGPAIAGTLSYVTATGVYSFTRTTPGSAAAVPNPAVIVVKSGLSGESIDVMRAAIQIWIAGRNDLGDGAGDPIDDAFDVQKIMGYLSLATAFTTTKRNVVSGVVNGATDKLTGDGGTRTTALSSWTYLKNCQRINAAYRAVYGHQFVDIMALAEAAGLTETYTVNGETFQVMLRSFTDNTVPGDGDGLHPGNLMGKQFMAKAIRDHILSKGY